MTHGLAFANTYHKSHATFYGPGYSSTIDFVLIPKTLLAEVSKCHTLLGMATRLSSINTRQLRDHAPLLLQWRVAFAADAKKDIVWDRNKLMQALQGDFKIRDGFTVMFNRQFWQTMDKGEVQYTPDTIWSRLSQVVRAVAEVHFAKKPDPVIKTLQTWKTRFLADRKHLRKQIGDTNQIVPDNLWFFQQQAHRAAEVLVQ